MLVASRICCLDLDTFFVSVERLHDPSLVGKPVVIGAAPGQRGVVTAASYEVRAFGVRAGQSITEAARLAPHAIFRPTRHGEYGAFAAQVREILERHTPEVRAASIDEFFLDFSGCERLHRLASDADEDATIKRTVWAMRDAIQAEVGLPASAGIGVSRPIAKIASGQAKPAGVRMVPIGAERAFLAPLAVGRFPGIGPVAQARLQAAGIQTLGDLLAVPPGPLGARFGGLARTVAAATVAPGTAVAERPAFREYDDPSQGVAGSISNERTFHSDVGDREGVDRQLRKLVERTCWRARQRQVAARTVTLKLRTADFHTVTRSITGAATHHESAVLARTRTLLDRAWDGRQAVRLVGVALSQFRWVGAQLLLPLGNGRTGRAQAIDAVRDRFGYDAIRLGATRESSTWIA